MTDQNHSDAFNQDVTWAEQRHQEALRKAEEVFDEMRRKNKAEAYAYRAVAVAAADQQYHRDVAALRSKHNVVQPTIGNRA